jgi:hypothetical protein
MHKRFWNYLAQTYSMVRWCVMHKNKTNSPKVKVRLRGQRTSGNFVLSISLSCIKGFWGQYAKVLNIMSFCYPSNYDNQCKNVCILHIIFSVVWSILRLVFHGCRPLQLLFIIRLNSVRCLNSNKRGFYYTKTGSDKTIDVPICL